MLSSFRPSHCLIPRSPRSLLRFAPLSHPLDLTKVQMQTARQNDRNTIQFIRGIVAERGVRGVYDGLTAAMLRA